VAHKGDELLRTTCPSRARIPLWNFTWCFRRLTSVVENLSLGEPNTMSDASRSFSPDTSSLFLHHHPHARHATSAGQVNLTTLIELETLFGVPSLILGILVQAPIADSASWLGPATP
jgi:hypothetical protein